jgi:hypothetical protein
MAFKADQLSHLRVRTGIAINTIGSNPDKATRDDRFRTGVIIWLPSQILLKGLLQRPQCWV